MFFSLETLEKLREEGVKKYNRELREYLKADDLDDLGIELAIDYHAVQVERLKKFISALKTVRTFEDLQDVLFVYDYIMDDVNDILNNI